jgi:precorrin-2/cobalt-factor-2 C20-methyltransferase
MNRLVGVGVGPGDPELVTVKAVRVMRDADVVLVPVLAGDEPGRAEATVRAYVPADRLRRAVFTMDEGRGTTPRREAAWDAAAAEVLRAFDGGATTVAFATIGDPNVYSTFTYLATTVRTSRPDVAVETVPGITAMQDLAARAGTVLCEGTETLALFPLTAGLDRFGAALRAFDTVVAYKGGRHLPAVLDVLRSAGRLDDAVYGASLGLPGEQVLPAAQVTGPGPYLSTLLVPARRDRRGGKL